jgi:hypothetical protein
MLTEELVPYSLPVVHRQALFAPGEALSAVGIERSENRTPQLHADKSNPLMPVWNPQYFTSLSWKLNRQSLMTSS